jgi:O-antigen/teichoic acid export membrane protein
MPFAMLNLGVLFTFSTLFTPSAARLLARGALPAVRDLYWQNAIWVSLLTFPVLAMTAGFARQFTVVTLGERYESSAVVLTVLSLGCYVNAVFGFNGLTVQLLERTRWILVANLVTLGFLVPATYLLVERLGAVGAAVSVLSTIVVHNLLKQAGLGFGAGIGLAERHHALVLLAVAALVGGLVALDQLSDPPLWLCLVLSALAWLALIWSTRRLLRLHEVFPEARRFLLTRWLVVDPSRRDSGRG